MRAASSRGRVAAIALASGLTTHYESSMRDNMHAGGSHLGPVERNGQTLELVVASPAPYVAVLSARATASR